MTVINSVGNTVGRLVAAAGDGGERTAAQSATANLSQMKTVKPSDARAVVLVAMPDEEEPFLARASAVGDTKSVGLAVHRTIELDGVCVLLVRTGIGLVNAAGAATSAILATAVPNGRAEAMLVSAGTAGGIGEAVRVGDLVIGSEHINIDADARAFGYLFGQVPRMPASYRGNDEAIEALTTSDFPRQFLPSTVHVGLITSSYAFVTPARALAIRQALPAVLATDMESVAIAQTSFTHNRRFLSIRAISDLCGPSAEADFRTHVDDAAERSAGAVAALLARLPH